MIRIVTDFVPNPQLLVMCDDKNCGCYSGMNLDPKKDATEQMGQVVKELIKQGWSIGLMGTWCDGHVRMMVEGAKAAEKRIVPASSLVDISSFTRINGRSH